MAKKLERFSLAARIIAVVVLSAFVLVGYWQVRDFYADKVGNTPERSIQAYFSALADGSYAEVYRLTNKDTLTDIYGRRVTEAEFTEQLRGVTGDNPLPFGNVKATEIAEQGDYRYYVVEIQSTVGGTSGRSRLLVEVIRSGSDWLVSYPFAIAL